MSPTIRIDDEVYKWLQNKAKPFEDTPNSVLRRIAELDDLEDKAFIPHTLKKFVKTKKEKKELGGKRMDGKTLNELWNVGARHALYHREGCWYNNLEHFPGAFFDPNGYILFKNESEYRNCSFLRITKETNVRNGISSIPGYVKMT
jgi:5-methylcytosine-specific restriction protein A